MAVYRLGSHGPEIRQAQERLHALGFFRGPLDGNYSAEMKTAVLAFQRSRQLSVDGVVGTETWNALFERAVSAPALAAQPVKMRCLSLTGTFETGKRPPDCFAGLSGDFDGQGISLGVLQWNFGQDSLQPLLRQMISRHPRIIAGIFQSNFDVLNAALAGGKAELMQFARGIQNPMKHLVNEPWHGMFKALCRTDEFQAIQAQYADQTFKSAQKLAGEYGLRSQRALALMFDIKVQNGSISELVKARILADFESLPGRLPEEETEVQRMVIVANRRAEDSNPKWVEDVRTRKLCIARGEGVVHGIRYNLAEQFGIGLESAA